MPRRFKTPVLIAAFVLSTACLFAQKPIEARPIRIENGKLLGVLTADQKVIAYKGIPYAAPPLEQLRWRPPLPLGRWKGTVYARDFGPHCMQFDSYPDMVFHDPGPSEDCLTLNVWTPSDAAQPSKKTGPGLPVMVWIYGGGFKTGGTSENRQNGQFLAEHGVVVVSMNYRLGVFGFMAHPELTAESGNHSSGNYGLMDQAAALAWVRRNIAAFGGDPNNITLFGQSAGSESVSAQMASPLTSGLFQKAIGESGSEFPRPGRSFTLLVEAEQQTTAWAERAFGSSRLFLMRSVPAEEIVKAAMARNAPEFRPIVDGSFLPDTLAHIYADGKQAHIPLLGGWVANEALPNGTPTAASFTAQAHADFGADASAFLALYPAADDTQGLQSADDYASDRYMGFPTWTWLEAHAHTGQAPVYRYFFDLPSPGDRNHSLAAGAFHSDDIEYVFGTLDSRPGMAIRLDDRTLSERMQSYWINFARTGDPNGPGLPTWPAYTPQANWPVMRLDAHPAAAPDTLRPRYLFLERAWTHR